jgi:hypothetical protein
MCAFASPFAVSAQATAKAAAQPKKERSSLWLVPEAHYGAPLRAAAGAALLVRTKPWRCEDGWCAAPGVEVQAMTGQGGWRIGGGFASIGIFTGDALVTVTRTRSAPRGASPESTYLGAEGGLSVPFYGNENAFFSVRPSIGIAHRVHGAGTSADRTTFAWNVGVTLTLPLF